MRHKIKWTWVSGSGGYLYFATKTEAISHALNYSGFAVYPPLYGD